MRGRVTGRAIMYIPPVGLIWGTRGTQGVSGGSNRQGALMRGWSMPVVESSGGVRGVLSIPLHCTKISSALQ